MDWDDYGYDNSEEVPVQWAYEAGYSNRVAECRFCGKGIAAGLLRIALLQPRTGPLWYHFECIFSPGFEDCPRHVSQISGTHTLSATDVHRLERAIVETCGAVHEDEAGGGFKVQVAKSGRSTCRKCKRTIDKDELRVAYMTFTSERKAFQGVVPAWHHLGCFTDYQPVSYKSFSGFQALDADDVMLLKSQFGESLCGAEGGNAGCGHADIIIGPDEEEEEDDMMVTQPGAGSSFSHAMATQSGGATVSIPVHYKVDPQFDVKPPPGFLQGSSSHHDGGGSSSTDFYDVKPKRSRIAPSAAAPAGKRGSGSGKGGKGSKGGSRKLSVSSAEQDDSDAGSEDGGGAHEDAWEGASDQQEGGEGEEAEEPVVEVEPSDRQLRSSRRRTRKTYTDSGDEGDIEDIIKQVEEAAAARAKAKAKKGEGKGRKRKASKAAEQEEAEKAADAQEDKAAAAVVAAVPEAASAVVEEAA